MVYLLSIVIPTRDREKYCIACLEHMHTVFTQEVQFVVQDNSTSDEITNWYNNHDYSNVTYNHVYEPLSPIDNYNKAIELANGKYIIFVGDDDIVLSNALDLVKWADSEGIDSIAQKRNVSYTWPYEGCNGLLLLPHVRKPEVIGKCDLKYSLINYLKDGCCDNPRLYHLPSFYHGIIKRTVLEKVKMDTGNYLGGLSSDSYSSTALCFYVKHHIEINKFFTLPGACPSSTTIANMQKNHCGELSKAPHLKNRVNYKWNESIPEYYSVQTIWSESVLQALNDTGNQEYCKYFSLEEEFARAYALNPTIRRLIVDKTNEVLNKQEKNLVLFYMKAYLKMFIFSISSFINRAYCHFFAKRVIINNIHNISDCIKFIPQENIR